MSYILDALRKSDQQRQRGSSPSLLTVHEIVDEPRSRASLVYGLLVVAMIGSGIVIGWLRPWYRAQPSSAAETIVASLPEQIPQQDSRARVIASMPPPPPTAAPVPEDVPPPAPVLATVPSPATSPGHVTVQAHAPDRASVVPEVTRKTLPESLVQKPSALVSGSATKVVKRKPSTVDRAEPARKMVEIEPAEKGAEVALVLPPEASMKNVDQEQKVINLAELPLPIQQGIPPMSVQVHSYSEAPEQRLVGINDRLLKEGDAVAPGLRLEQITPDGMIFSYKKYRFRYGR